MKNDNEKLNDTQKMFRKILYKLLSEEWFAATMYWNSIEKCCDNERHNLDTLDNIAIDELQDHFVKLAKVCYGCQFDDIPTSEKEFEKYADKDVVSQYKHLKNNQRAGYYIGEAIKAEMMAIDSYQDGIDQIEGEDYGIKAVLMSIQWEEVEHLNTLKTLNLAYENAIKIML